MAWMNGEVNEPMAEHQAAKANSTEAAETMEAAAMMETEMKTVTETVAETGMNATDALEIRRSTEADNAAVHAMLRRYNARFVHDTGDFSAHIERDGKLVGGIVAGGCGDTLEVEFLCVDETYRGLGLGAKLLQDADRRAREQGLRRVILDTFSFQAPEFYKKLGYTELFTISPAFDTYSHTYLVKSLLDE